MKKYIKPETIKVMFEAQGVIAASLRISDKQMDSSAEGQQLTNQGGWNSNNWE